MPQAGASTSILADATVLMPERPMNDDADAGGALDTVVEAGESLAAESAVGMQAAHESVLEEQREEAAESAARAKREAQRWVKPLADYRITATFGSTGRLWSSRHTGIDLAASYSDEVSALSTGEIIWAGWEGPYGNKIVVRHWDGTETWYCHLSRIIQRSGTVAPGEVIGTVGSTGRSTGPHLHLEVHPSDSGAVNPRTFLSERGVEL